MSSEEVDGYIAAAHEPARATLTELRSTILSIVPDAEEGLGYGSPVFRIDGKAVAGFAVFDNHLSYLPHSGSVLTELADELDGYTTSKGALRFEPETPLPVEIVRALIEARRREIAASR
ncbi:MAG: iron chaperone [Microthrixaceae bacterium]